MSKLKRGFGRKMKEHDKIALRKMHVEPVKGVTRKQNVVHKLLDEPERPKRNKKLEEEAQNEGKILCGVAHPKNNLPCVVPIDEHVGKQHHAWNITRGGFNQEGYSKVSWGSIVGFH